MAFTIDIVRPDEGTVLRRTFQDGSYLVGRGAACLLQLPHPDVSERHAILVLNGDKARIEDLHSANGTYVNGLPTDGITDLPPDSVVEIGGTMLRISFCGTDEVSVPQATPISALQETDTVPCVSKNVAVPMAEKPVFNESMRLGPLEKLLEDETVTEIMVNGPHRVYIERNGKLQLTDLDFLDDSSVMEIIERIVSSIGRRIDEYQPYVDARLADGSRVNAIIPPLSLTGPTLTVRKFAKRTFTPEDFVRFGTWTHNAAEFIKACVMMRKNVIVAGGTGSGKTTLLNLLSGFIPQNERIVSVEDAAELRLAQPHVIRLEARPPDIEGRGAVTIRDLVKNCLRMRPDRIIVGECRGGEALDMLQAMNTGHDGSLTTVHANSPRDVISRLETMVLMSGMDLPSRAIREQIASAVDIIVHESRLSDGSRKVLAISEVTGLDGQDVTMQDIFAFRQRGIDAHGRILGEFNPTGAVPTFYEQMKSRGLRLDSAIFNPGHNRDISLEMVEYNA